MKLKPSFLFFLLLVGTLSLQAQKKFSLAFLSSGNPVSFRGLSVVNDQIFWASGSNGTVARSTNGGKKIEWLTVKGYEKSDFRDIEAFDSLHAIIMAIESPGILLETKDGGKNWSRIFTDTAKGVFLDALSFNKAGAAVVVGDPVQNKMAYILYKKAGNNDFKRLSKGPALQTGEAFFAASGTNVQFIPGTNDYVYVSGGNASRFFRNDQATILPLRQGKETTGANSIAVWDKKKMYVVGGDFQHDKDTTGNACYTNDGGNTWLYPETPPHGYRSCVQYITEDILIASGTSGVDISTDGGKNWTNLSPFSLHVCQKAKNGQTVYLAGQYGRIAKLNIQ